MVNTLFVTFSGVLTILNYHNAGASSQLIFVSEYNFYWKLAFRKCHCPAGRMEQNRRSKIRIFLQKTPLILTEQPFFVADDQQDPTRKTPSSAIACLSHTAVSLMLVLRMY